VIRHVVILASACCREAVCLQQYFSYDGRVRHETALSQRLDIRNFSSTGRCLVFVPRYQIPGLLRQHATCRPDGLAGGLNERLSDSVGE
jgi:hypothetical protein